MNHLIFHKVGGGSVKDNSSVKILFERASYHMKKPTILVISAFGKTTNMFEHLALYIHAGMIPAANKMLGQIILAHTEIMDKLFPKKHN